MPFRVLLRHVWCSDEASRSHCQAAVRHVSTSRLESMHCLGLVPLGSHFPIVCKQRLQAVKGKGAATAVSFTKACIPPVSVCSNFHPPETEGARLRHTMLVRCCPGLPSPGLRQMWNAICRRHELSIYCKQLEVLSWRLRIRTQSSHLPADA